MRETRLNLGVCVVIAFSCVWSCGGRAEFDHAPPTVSFGAGGTAGTPRVTPLTGGASAQGGHAPQTGVAGRASGGSAEQGDGGAGGVAAGGVGATAGSSSGGAGGDDDRTPGICEQEVVWSSNLNSCVGGFLHRPKAIACALPARDTFAAQGGGPSWLDCPASTTNCDRNFVCNGDSDCGLDEICIADAFVSFDKYHVQTSCIVPCQTDGDCYLDEVCACSQLARGANGVPIEVGLCLPAQCKVDADCGQGVLCTSALNDTPASRLGSFRPSPFACQAALDTCRGQDDCPQTNPVSCYVNTCELGGAARSCVERSRCR